MVKSSKFSLASNLHTTSKHPVGPACLLLVHVCGVTEPNRTKPNPSVLFVCAASPALPPDEVSETAKHETSATLFAQHFVQQ